MRGDACSLLTWLLAFDQKERKKIEAWVALVYFQQLDESFVRLLGCTTEGKMGRDGGVRLEIAEAEAEENVEEFEREDRKHLLPINSFLAADDRIKLTLVSIRDGLTLCRRLY
ncbi:flavonoid 3',5'-methyltransferase-like [Prunus persica]|uniref:flavonoid 3',5'-methyltransferase-like n=1 Tax=Prunus persica TaxID=3760 RepID=UPI0009AB2BBD|nr:flavonoid 3',5'-methyltransferase-like [Prunus persica]